MLKFPIKIIILFLKLIFIINFQQFFLQILLIFSLNGYHKKMIRSMKISRPHLTNYVSYDIVNRVNE